MGAKEGLELLAPLAATFENDPDVPFVFSGDGAFRPTLESLVRDHSNVTLLPLQPLERRNDLLNAADIHLLPQRAGAADLVMPSKLTGSLSSGRPVIATADPGTQVARVVAGDETQPANGLVVPAEDQVALHAAVGCLIRDQGLRRQLGANARRYAVRHLGKQQVLEQFERDVASLVSSIG